MRIGIDFDNTIAGYDRLFGAIGRDQHWIDDTFRGTKKDIRDAVRLLDDGEAKWMRMQALAYGTHMSQAEMIEGMRDFLRECKAGNHDVFIVSHKTRFAAADPDGVDLRQASLAWMQANGLFDDAAISLPHANVFFEDTRQDKCRRIAQLECAVFIDDLEEVFADPVFPATTAGLLYHAGDLPLPDGPFRAFATLKEIGDAVFGR